MQNSQLKPAYNTQIGTEEGQFFTLQYSSNTSRYRLLQSHLDSFEQQYGLQSQVVGGYAGYGSEENYDIMRQNKLVHMRSLTTFTKSKSASIKNDHFSPQNLYYNSKDDYYICPMGSKMQLVDKNTRTTRNDL
ncbi:MAG: hypothetical protein IPN72_13045 [Saprospiraceae bacterium]|nr:hypothetical protein [Saprospiraceae bacterium]